MSEAPARLTVSVAMCTYNGAPWLVQQLQSLVNQERRPDELVVCDDQSDDQTFDILQQFTANAPFEVRLFRNPQRLGFRGNFGTAIGRCRCDVIHPADQDDLWLPHKIRVLNEAIEQDVGTLLAGGMSLTCDDQLNSKGFMLMEANHYPARFLRDLQAGRCLTTMIRQPLFAGHAMAFRATLRPVILPLPDHWLHDTWIQTVASCCGCVRALEDVVVHYRQHDRNVSGGNRRSMTGWAAANRALTYNRLQVDAQRFRDLADRVENHRARLTDPERVVRLTRAKATFMDRRVRVNQHRVLRVPLVLKELVLGRYHRHARGLLTFGRDLLSHRLPM